MRMKIFLILLICFSKFSYSAESGYILKVLASKGKVEFLPAGKADKVMLKTGSEIKTKGEIILEEKEYLSLTHSSGNLLELSKTGRYSVNEIEEAINKKSSTFTGKFIDFVGNKLAGSGNKTKEMKSTGAVVRLRDDYLFVDLPSKSLLLNDSLSFNFEVVDPLSNYFLYVSNKDGQLVFVQELQKEQTSLNTIHSQLIEGRSYKLVVKGVGSTQLISDTIVITIADKNLSQTIKDSVSHMIGELGTALTPQSAICLAVFYEQNGFLINAYKMYKTAVTQIDGVEEFENLYIEFLINNGLIYKAEQFIFDKMKSERNKI